MRCPSVRNVFRVVGAFDDVGMDGVGFGFFQVSGKAGHSNLYNMEGSWVKKSVKAGGSSQFISAQLGFMNDFCFIHGKHFLILYNNVAATSTVSTSAARAE